MRDSGFFRNLNRINVRIDQVVEGHQTQPPGFLKQMHEADPYHRKKTLDFSTAF